MRSRTAPAADAEWRARFRVCGRIGEVSATRGPISAADGGHAPRIPPMSYRFRHAVLENGLTVIAEENPAAHTTVLDAE